MTRYGQHRPTPRREGAAAAVPHVEDNAPVEPEVSGALFRGAFVCIDDGLALEVGKDHEDDKPFLVPGDKRHQATTFTTPCAGVK